MAFRFLLIVWLLTESCGWVFADEVSWQENKSTHFIVFAQEQSPFVDDVLRKAEDVYSDEVGYFGSLPPNGFWTWENRCKVYIYVSAAEYQSRTGQPDWSTGFADVKRRSIVSYQEAPEFMDSVLPHEMAHLIFREFIEIDNRQVPRWLDEGFAVAQEERMRVSLDEVIHKAVRSNSHIPIRALSQVGSLQSRPAEQARLFYSEAQSLTRFLLEKRDPSPFINFCRALRDGNTIEEALRKSYDRDYPNIESFERAWKRYVLSS